MAKANREAFTLNELNPKEKVIFDFLQTQYNKSQVIKDILYEYIMSNNLQVSTQTLQKNSIINTKESANSVSNVYKDLPKDDKKKTKECIENNKKIYKSKPKDIVEDDDFKIDLNTIEDEEVDISSDSNKKSGIENAMDFILNM